MKFDRLFFKYDLYSVFYMNNFVFLIFFELTKISLNFEFFWLEIDALQSVPNRQAPSPPPSPFDNPERPFADIAERLLPVH